MLETYALSFALILARVSAFIGFFPLFGRQQVPSLVKAGLATALTLFWFGATPTSADSMSSTNALLIVLLMVKEVAIGIILAMLVGLLLVPARIAGSYVGQEIGLSMDPVTNSSSEQSTIMASIFEAFAILMFFGLNLHHFLILFLHHSLGALAGKIDLLNLPVEGLVGILGRLTEYGLSIVGPVAVVSFIILIGLFLLSKAAPALNLFSVGMPLRVGLGLVVLLLFIPVLWRSIGSYFLKMIGELEEFAGYFMMGS